MGTCVKGILLMLGISLQLIYGSPTLSKPAGPYTFLLPPGAVIIDPGHGGRDPGAVVSHQGSEVYEKDIALAASLMLREYLQQQMPHIEVHMTRDDDAYLSLQQRVQTANSVIPPQGTSRVFISIHANAAPVRSASGFEVWRYPGRKVQRFLTSEVKDPFFEELTDSFNLLLQQELEHADSLLAESMHAELARTLEGITPDRGIREENFYVLRFTRMPAVLIEMGFMTNPEELEMLLDEEHLETIIRAAGDALQRFSESLP